MVGSRTRLEWLTSVLPVLLVGAVLALAALVGLRPGLRRYVVLGAGGLAFAVLVQHPGLGLVALAALSFTLPLEFGTGSAVSLTAPVFLIAAVAAAWLLHGLRAGAVRLPRSRTTLPLLLFVASGLLSLLAGRAYWDPLVPQPGNLTLVQSGQWAIFALSAVIFLVTGELGRRGRWLEWATWAFLAVGSLAVLEWYVPVQGRVLGWHQSSHRSMFWTWLAALAAGQLVFNQGLGRLARLWLIALLGASAYLVWFPFRDWVSGWVPLSVAVGTVAWLRVWREHRSAGVVLAVALLALGAVLYPVLFEHAGGEQELDMSWGGREVLYRATLDLVKEHPILGLGPAAYRHYAHTRWLSLGVGRALYIRPNVSSHNNYIDVYAQMGLVGLGLFLWFLFEVGRLGWRLLPRFEGDFRAGYVYGTVGGLAGTLVAMMLVDWFLPYVYNVGFPGFRTSALAWMFLGGLVALEGGERGRRGEGETG
jgi:O-antigen ligase